MSTEEDVSPTESLRKNARLIADTLCSTDIGGTCYHGHKHSCFVNQGRRPLALYKSEEMCERCQASWFAAMTAALLDSLVLGQQFIGDGDAFSQDGSSAPQAPNEERRWNECGKCGRDDFRTKSARMTHERHCRGKRH